MTIKYYKEVVQGSDEWFALRCGILTASEVNKILTPTLKIANNDETRSHAYELLAQRITKYVEPTYIGDDMVRGHTEEVLAKIAYSEKYEPITEMGFITNDEYGFPFGFSPDGLVCDDGMVECKSRKQKFQIETILAQGMPQNSKINCMLQIQSGLLVTKRKWCDFLSYHGGLPMVAYRIYPIPEIQEAIIQAGQEFENKLKDMMNQWDGLMVDENMRLIPTERIIEEEIVV